MTPGHKAFEALKAKGTSLGRKLTAPEVIACLDEQFALQAKERRKAAIDDRAEGIYKLYPNRQGGTAALTEITNAIAEDGFDFVLKQTTLYAQACARYNKDDRSKIPHATTWFHQRRYRLDDVKTWFKGGGEPSADELNAQAMRRLPAPTGWMVWATNKRSEWSAENGGYEAPGGGAIDTKNFFALPQSWQTECRQHLNGMQHTA